MIKILSHQCVILYIQFHMEFYCQQQDNTLKHTFFVTFVTHLWKHNNLLFYWIQLLMSHHLKKGKIHQSGFILLCPSRWKQDELFFSSFLSSIQKHFSHSKNMLPGSSVSGASVVWMVSVLVRHYSEWDRELEGAGCYDFGTVKLRSPL